MDGFFKTGLITLMLYIVIMIAGLYNQLETIIALLQ